MDVNTANDYDENNQYIVGEGVNYLMDEEGAKEVSLWLDSIGFTMYNEWFLIQWQ